MATPDRDGPGAADMPWLRAAAAAVLLGALAAAPVLDARWGAGVLAIAGLALAIADRDLSPGEPGPEAKLLFLAAVLGPVAAMLSAATSAEAWLLLAIPVYLGLRGLPFAPWVIWAGAAAGALIASAAVGGAGMPELGSTPAPAFAALALGVLPAAALAALLRRPAIATAALAAGAVVLIGLGTALDLEHLEPAGWLGGRGAFATVALALALVLPGRAFRDALARPDASSRALGAAGLTVLAVWLAGAASGTALNEPSGAALWALTAAAVTAALHERARRRLDQPATRRHSLSATVICFNEADRIRTCLDSLAGWADEIVVLDSGSTDGTPEIAREYTDRVEVTDWPGYGPQKQRALERATGEWVLSIDADEAATAELRHDIDAALSADEPECVGYELPWAVTVYGRRLDFGRSARAPLRLFRREGARFTEDLVHETVRPPEGPVGRLQGRLRHYTARDFGHALRKSSEYAWLGAQDKYRRNPRVAAFGLALAPLVAAVRFIHIYVLRLGFLDGAAGFLVAALYAQTAFNKYAGAWTLRRQACLQTRAGDPPGAETDNAEREWPRKPRKPTEEQ